MNGNNGLMKRKFMTYTIEADSLKMARARLRRIETDLLGYFKSMGASAWGLDAKERLEVMHSIFHPDGEPFSFDWKWLAPSGLSTKDFIAPSSFRFGNARMFGLGGKYGAVSFLQILSPELSDEKKIGMLIVQDQIWGRVTQNRSKGKATWYFCDEFHLLLREEQTAAFSCEIWKRFRKWGGIPTGATQNVKDLLSSPEIENILENSDFICLLNQASGDRKILAERLNISPQQLRYVDNSEPGEGLLIYENVILPFKNPIPKNTQLYQIMTTRLGEGATV